MSSLLAACGAAPGSAPRLSGAVATEQTNFPSKELIAKIAATPTPARLFDDNAKDVPTWELTGPLPDAVDRAPPQDDSPWGKLFVETAAARGEAVLTTLAMHCVARENAAFYLANDALPAEMLERFIAARCGAPTGLAGTSFQIITGDARTPDEKLFTQFRDRVKDMIDKMLKAGQVEAGLAFVRKGGRAVIALSVVPQTVRLDRTPLVPGADGKVVLRGQALGPAVGLRALINHGRHGYGECTTNPAVKLPRFEIACETARGDEVAWLSVSALPPGRVLGMPLVEMLVWPSGAPGKVYAKLARGAAASPGTSPDELLKEINEVRKEASLPPLRLAEQESRTATLLAPHYFAAMERGGEDIVPDQVALGLLAGWEVDGMVRNGHFVSTWIANASSWAEVVRSAISRPIGRETLLDPTAERVAVGPVATDRAHGAVFTTYALFDAYRHDDDARKLGARLTAARAARGLPAPRLVVDLSAEADRAARSVQAGQRAPEEALGELLQRASDKLGRNVRGWAAEITSLDRLEFPDNLQSMPSLTFGVGVAHHRRPGHAWGRFIVLLVVVDEGASGPMTARREGPHGG